LTPNGKFLTKLQKWRVKITDQITPPPRTTMTTPTLHQSDQLIGLAFAIPPEEAFPVALLFAEAVHL
jgi:hypothetical protein